MIFTLVHRAMVVGFALGMLVAFMLVALTPVHGFDDNDDMLTSPTSPFSMTCLMGAACLNPISPGYQLSHPSTVHHTNYTSTLQDMDIKLPAIRINSVSLWLLIAIIIAVILVLWYIYYRKPSA